MSNKQDVRSTVKHHPETIDLYRRWELMHKSGFQSFFPAKSIPDSCCSRTYVNKKGVTYAIPTIDDVVRWSKTLRGGKQEGFEFMYEEDDAHSPCSSGYCE